MTIETSVTAPDSNPVSAALSDPDINRRLLNAACAFLRNSTQKHTLQQRQAEAEVIVQDAKSEAWRRRADFDPNRDVVNWLVGFVCNVTRDSIKKYARTPTGPPPDSPGLEELAVDVGCDPAETLSNKELVETILAELKPNDRELLQQAYIDDLSFAEIAARRGTNAIAERVRCFRVIQQLRLKYRASGEVQS